MNPMTNRERIIATATGGAVDRLPFFFYFGPWGETLERWHTEGLPEGVDWQEGFGFDAGITILDKGFGYFPKFEYQLLEDRGDRIVFRDELGITQLAKKEGAAVPMYLDYPVKDRASWLELKKRLDPDDPARFPADWKAQAERLNRGDQAVQVGGWPYGLFGTLRDMMGVEPLLLAFYDDPELIADIMGTLTDLWIAVYAKICKDVKVDIIHIWEDMSGKNGSLISPAMVREFMLPNYRRIKAFADRAGIPVIALDTDGDCTELIPLFMESGINLLMPFEVAAGSDIVAYRKQFPGLGIMGGIDKREVALGRAATDRELDRIDPMFTLGGYYAMLDHQIHPEISWADFQYFTFQLKKRLGIH